jgi:hypothetical protein
LKWWIKASIEVPMISRMCSSEFPQPSPPSASWAGQAIRLSATITGPGFNRSRHCSMMFSDCTISSSRIRNRP